jgi:LmbE family N-acetylglucosaminyl deacetylase
MTEPVESAGGPEEAEGLMLHALEVLGEGVIFVGAHPDDETFALGGHLPRLNRARVVIVTDGAPRDLRDANTVGFASAAEYAAVRAEELAGAVAMAGIDTARLLTFGIPDQQPIFHLPEISRRLAELLSATEPWLVLTHAYEGGHPDHDAVAFAVHAACRLMAEDSGTPPDIVEMPYYRPGGDGAITQGFEPGAGPEPYVVELSGEQLALKNKMMDRHASQLRLFGRTSSSFRTNNESFRRAPDYDFSAPPNEGRVNYENWHLGVSGAQWMHEARKAIAELGFGR